MAMNILLTDVLKKQMGFDGPVVGDWDGVDEVQGCSRTTARRRSMPASTW